MIDPIPEAARWTGPPGPLVIRAILAVTYTDNQGRRYYRRSPMDGWRRLVGLAAFEELNAVIEKYRERESIQQGELHDR